MIIYHELCSCARIYLHYNLLLKQWTIQCKCFVFATFAAYIQPIFVFHFQQMRLYIT